MAGGGGWRRQSLRHARAGNNLSLIRCRLQKDLQLYSSRYVLNADAVVLIISITYSVLENIL